MGKQKQALIKVMHLPRFLLVQQGLKKFPCGHWPCITESYCDKKCTKSAITRIDNKNLCRPKNLTCMPICDFKIFVVDRKKE